MTLAVNPPWNLFSRGRYFIGRLNDGEDLNTAVAAFCREQSIETAVFQAGGTLSRVTVGVFDPFQRVYVTFSDDAPYEIAACCGTVTLQDGPMAARAQIVVCDREGMTTGGRLFSPTVVVAAEIYLEELLGAPLERFYEAETGQDFLRIARPRPKGGRRPRAASQEKAE